jgi:hypothetical protein
MQMTAYKAGPSTDPDLNRLTRGFYGKQQDFAVTQIIV